MGANYTIGKPERTNDPNSDPPFQEASRIPFTTKPTGIAGYLYVTPIDFVPTTVDKLVAAEATNAVGYRGAVGGHCGRTGHCRRSDRRDSAVTDVRDGRWHGRNARH